MDALRDAPLEGTALDAWRGFLQSYATIVRTLDAELDAGHGLTTRDYQVLLYLSQAEGRRLPMSSLAERTMLTRSGVTRLVDGLVDAGFVKRVACSDDARVCYAQLTPTGVTKLRSAGADHVASVNRLFVERFDSDELETLAELLGRLPGAQLGGPCAIDP